MENENLLFSVVVGEERASATEALLSFGVFQTQSEVPPLFGRNAVGRAIPVMAEGTYYVKQTVAGQTKYRPVTFTAEDIRRIAAKQPRDVPFNYDHRRAAGPDGVKGWLRFGKHGETPLHFVGEIATPDGQKLTALFATPELGPEAQEMVSSGIYRDVSVEYRSADDVLSGCALTSYPVMRDLQFSELDGQAAPDPETPSPEAEPAGEAAEILAGEVPVEDQMDLSKLTPEDRKKLLNDLLGDHNLSVDSLVQMGERFAQNEEQRAKTEHDLAMERAEKEITGLLGEAHFGMTDEIATAAQEALAWTSTNATLNFGEEGGAPDVGGVVRSLLGVVAKQGKQILVLGGPSAGTDETGEQHFGNLDPDLDADSKATVSGLASLAKSFL